jgi:hypothetical protein
MALPKATEPIRDILGDLIHTAVNCENDDSLSPLVPKLDAAHADLVARSQNRNRAEDGVVRKLASRELAFGRVDAALVSWEKALSVLCDDDQKRYATFFPVTVKKMLAAPIGERAARLDGILELAKASGYTGDVAAGAKKVNGMWAKYQGALAEVEKADKGVRQAEVALVASRVKACTFMREVHGRVQTAYPDDSKRVEAFFRKRSGKKAAKAPVVAAPGGGAEQASAG